MSSPLQNNITNLQSVLEAINELPKAGGEQVTPVISVNNSNGLITATAGTKTSTHQLAFQAAKTVTPSTLDQIAVSSGYYTGGNITVKGDANLVAGNIKSGVSIFGVNGTLTEGSSGGNDSAMEYGLVMRNITSYINSRVSYIGNYAFAYCSKLTSVSFPACTTIGSNAFYGCTSLTSVSFPVCTTIGSYAFRSCTSLTSISFPACTAIGDSAFYSCTKLTSVSFPACTTISSNAFYSCTKLTSVSFPACTTIGSYAFYSCTSLTSVSFPVCTTIGNYAFRNCSKLTSVSFPACTTIGNYAFAYCSKLTSVSFPACTTISSNAFAYCSKLTTIYIMASSVCALANSDAFYSTGIKSTTGSIYVPASLISSYKAATNWTYFSSRFVAYGSTMHSGGSSN